MAWQEGQAYADLYVRLLNKLSRSDTLQYVLVLVGDMLNGHTIHPLTATDRLTFVTDQRTRRKTGALCGIERLLRRTLKVRLSFEYWQQRQ